MFILEKYPTLRQIGLMELIWLLICSQMLASANTTSPKLHSFCQILLVLYVKFLAVNFLSGKISAKSSCENSEKT